MMVKKINMIGSFKRNYPFGTEIAFAKGLRNIGVEVYEWDPSTGEHPAPLWSEDADAVIVFKDHGEITYPHLEFFKNEKKVPVIEYQPDDIRAPGIVGMMKKMRQYCDYAFTFDKTGAEVAEQDLGYKKARKLIVTADPDLYKPLNIKKDIDICFVGSLSNQVQHESRRKMIQLLHDNGYKVLYQQSFFDANQINLLYNKSKLVINHATDLGQDFGFGYGYQCRHFEAGFAGSCLISNELLDNEGDGPEQFCRFISEEDLLDVVEIMLNGKYDSEPLWEMQGKMFLDELNEKFRPEHRAQDIVDFIEEVK